MEKEKPATIECKVCGAGLNAAATSDNKRPRFCSQCGALIAPLEETTIGERAHSDQPAAEAIRTITIRDEGVPSMEMVRFELGPYQILETVGLGGMGEVYLAFDPVCGRRVALKRIRSDLQTIKKLHSRFLREARITSQLTHPAIIPIYSIHTEEQLLYYTMPYVEGNTLKQILRKGMRQQRQGELVDGMAGSIPGLIRIFLSICHAIAYAHSRGVLHRDIKPENVIVGRYGQITILDWGLAKLISSQEMLEEDEDEDEEAILTEEEAEQLSTPAVDLTIPGKVVGTVSYLAPERVNKEPASVQSDIFALGVMLYQLLTLRLPFDRKSMKAFKKNVDREVLPDPAQVAPYRDISQVLNRIVRKCLARERVERYRTVDSLITDLEGYLEGRSDWLSSTKLNPHSKDDWEFQEHVLLTENLAIARHMEVTNWVNLMLSKATFPENIKLELRLRLDEGSEGVGLLFSVPEGVHRSHLSEGYCLWLGPENKRNSALYRSGVEVMTLKRCYLTPCRWYQVQIEKVDNRILVHLDDTLQCTYNSHLPLTGSHVGLMSKDADYHIERMTVYSGALNVRVSRLAIPDAFLNRKDYETALEEYRSIGASFPGRQEGREALFRAGYTLLEWGRQTAKGEERDSLFDRALEEFDSLHETPGAPLQYLGKSLVYKTLADTHEEINCLELGYRRYRKHPLVDVLEEQILYRMHDSSRLDRHATYRFALLAIQFELSVISSPNSKRLFSTIQNHWEPLPFIIESQERFNFAVQLAYWLAKPYAILELGEMILAAERADCLTLGNALFAMIELGAYPLARKLSERVEQGAELLEPMLAALHCDEKPLQECLDLFIETLPAQVTAPYFRTAWHLLNRLRLASEYQAQRSFIATLKERQLDRDNELLLLSQEIWSLLLEGEQEKAGVLLSKCDDELLGRESHPFFLLYGCWLAMKDGEAAAEAHFTQIADSPFPRSWSVLAHFVNGTIGLKGDWVEQAFSREKQQLFSQLTLYSYCCGRRDLAHHYHQQELEESGYGAV